ncbi:helix-turn-helix transcriptional regulator [Paracraurococcus lichenis]|uniref:LuxR C-terminal-related transcriptional regulator n=1 Tax=Paracraurococcus lichenis TaxID=3064888 RepID=A0ABT9DXJ9_9PROT|nr:LuxR C-terminal-related transcriptional regulator [Paracraurococcus sp. LOR1-02]MDO9708627.1 LuxR C-terminal-related transcriptional regulator [Paracraurococcus sp. LOR1-02]
MPGEDDSFDAVVDLLYDAAAGITGWEAALNTLVRDFDATVGAFSIVGPHLPGRILHTGTDPVLVARYLERHAGRNELALRTSTLPAGAVVTDADIMPKGEFMRMSFYQDCLQPAGLHALMNCRAAQQPNGLLANICLFRTAAQGDFGPAEVARYRRLAPHLCRAAAVEIRVAEAEGERHALAEALERLSAAAFVVDAAATVLRANAAGAALLAARDGLQNDNGGGGALRAALPSDTAALRRLVAAANGAGQGVQGGTRLCLARPAPRPPLVVTVLPLGACGGAASGLPPAAVALLLAASPGLPAEPPPTGLLRDAFGLTRAEAEVAAHAALGEDAVTIAAALGITQGTARLHLHRVFEKTGVRRQAELCAVLARLAP